jgi:hypothetical protein
MSIAAFNNFCACHLLYQYLVCNVAGSIDKFKSHSTVFLSVSLKELNNTELSTLNCVPSFLVKTPFDTPVETHVPEELLLHPPYPDILSIFPHSLLSISNTTCFFSSLLSHNHLASLIAVCVHLCFQPLV